MKVSATLIVKDEEQNLPRCIGSLEGLADEVVVVDTGSEDGTVRLARDLGATVIVGADRMHKGAARNAAQDHATGDWVVTLDADEEMDDPAALREFLSGTDADAVYLRGTRVKPDGSHVLSQRQMRCWKRGLYRWRYRAHEIPVSANGKRPKVAYTDFTFWHHHRHAEWKKGYTLERIALDVKDHPDAARPLFYLARELMYVKKWDAALARFEEFLARFPDAWDAADAWANLSRCYGRAGRVRERVTALHQALALKPRRREWWGELAQAYYDQNQYDVAAGMLSAALAMDPPKHSYKDYKWYGPHVYDLLARCLYHAGTPKLGRPFAERAVELDPENGRLKKNLAFFAKDADPEDVIP